MSEHLPKLLDMLSSLVFLVLIPLALRFIRNSQVRDAILLLNEQAKLAVDRLNKDRRELQDPERPGAWTSEQGERLKAAAMREVIRVLGESFSLLEKHYGSEGQVRQLISNAIEAHVESTRPAGAPARVSVPATPPASPSVSPDEPSTRPSESVVPDAPPEAPTEVSAEDTGPNPASGE